MYERVVSQLLSTASGQFGYFFDSALKNGDSNRLGFLLGTELTGETSIGEEVCETHIG